jgi:hypothetical protein
VLHKIVIRIELIDVNINNLACVGINNYMRRATWQVITVIELTRMENVVLVNRAPTNGLAVYNPATGRAQVGLFSYRHSSDFRVHGYVLNRQKTTRPPKTARREGFEDRPSSADSSFDRRSAVRKDLTLGVI